MAKLSRNFRDFSHSRVHEKRWQISHARKKYIQISRRPLLLPRRVHRRGKKCALTPCVIIKPNKRNGVAAKPAELSRISSARVTSFALLYHRSKFTYIFFLAGKSLNPAGSSRWFLGKAGFRGKFIRPRETCLHSYVIENSSALHIAGRISREINRALEREYARRGAKGGQGSYWR